MVNDSNEVVVLAVDERRLGFRLSTVEKIIRAVAVTPLPDMGPAVLGVINVHGTVIPVVDLRLFYGMGHAEVGPGDQFVLVRTAKRLLALVVDSVVGVMTLTAGQMMPADEVPSHDGYIEGVAKAHDGLILLQDAERFAALVEPGNLAESRKESHHG